MRTRSGQKNQKDTNVSKIDYFFGAAKPKKAYKTNDEKLVLVVQKSEEKKNKKYQNPIRKAKITSPST